MLTCYFIENKCKNQTYWLLDLPQKSIRNDVKSVNIEFQKTCKFLGDLNFLLASVYYIILYYCIWIAFYTPLLAEKTVYISSSQLDAMLTTYIHICVFYFFFKIIICSSGKIILWQSHGRGQYSDDNILRTFGRSLAECTP